MNEKISGFVICVEVLIYLLLHNLHDCTFKNKHDLVNETQEEDKDYLIKGLYITCGFLSESFVDISKALWGLGT